MERHQTGQEETLMEVRVDSHRGSPAGHRCCFKCAVASASLIGLVIMALVVAGFILHFFIFMPSCNQEAPPLSGTEKINIACRLKKSADRGSYYIFTAEKTATYLIYGWVKLSDATGEEVVLKQTLDKDTMSIRKKKAEETEIFFFERVELVSGMRIIISFKSNCKDNLFHVYEL